MFTLGRLFKSRSWTIAQDPVPPSSQNLLQNLTEPNPEWEAIVTQTIAPRKVGQVKYQGTWWNARCRKAVTLLPGEIVYVVDRWDVTTLYVEPDPFANPVASPSSNSVVEIDLLPEHSKLAIQTAIATMTTPKSHLDVN